MTPFARFLLPLLLCASLHAQTRYALVIGNGEYPFASLGQTPINDANAMRDALTLAGFQVDYYTNLQQDPLSDAITAFGRKIKGSSGVALFYYSGHGVQHKNQNYLVPIGAELSDEEDIEGECIPINRITAKMQGAGTSINLVLLDACRAIPISREGKALTKGLAKEDYSVPELLVAYATAPGSTATVRGEGGLSLYTSQLLKHLKTPGLILENVLKYTRRDVIDKSKGQQRPDETGNLTSDFYFFPATAQPDPTQSVPGGKEVPSPTTPPTGGGGGSDRDLDGTPDATDLCPDDYGAPAANGCPDYDEDGVPNAVDKCPNLPGKKEWQGCPDSDGDGLPDHEDKCPAEKGSFADKGCPPSDADRDGVPDATDLCPNQYGLPSLRGCPDTDGDGVADKSDKCPDKAGLPKFQGCPDTDGDGIPDQDDLCPTAKGSAAAKGCPDLSLYGYLPSDFVRVAGGTFQMGSNDYDSEKPIHAVTVPSFEMGKYEVTNAQFCLFLNDYGAEKVKSGNDSGQTMIYEHDWGVKKNPSGKWSPAPGYENHPLVYVTWYGAVAYCEWLSQKTGQTYHLPSEAEWEYAAKGGKQSKAYQYAGSNTLEEVAWYSSNAGSKTHPVGQKNANELGLYDLSGNVWEWCADTWHDTYAGAPANGSAWTSGGDQDRAVLRGGSWYYIDGSCRSAYRGWYDRAYWNDALGLRVARVAAAGGR